MVAKEKRSIAIVSGKGGIGKTTLAINLGYLLQREFGIDTIVVDCNLTTPHLSLNLGLHNFNLTLNHVLNDKAKIEEAIIEHPCGIRILPASLELDDLKGVDIFRLPEKIDELNFNVLIDSAPGLGREGIAAISAADEILFVTQPFSSAVVDIYRCKKIAEKLNKKILGIVVNATKKTKYELTNDEIERLTEVPVIENIPYDLEIEKALAVKLPLPLYNPKAKANKSFYSLASKLTGIELARKETFFKKIKNLFKL
jgi:septum site-determining protein MinD